MIFKDRIIDIISFLENGKSVLLPCEHTWEVAISLQNRDMYQHLLNSDILGNNCTILFESLDHLKQNLPRLHPRVETLLVYYKRPFLMKVNKDELSKIQLLEPYCYVSIARNEFLKTILSLLGQALILFRPTIKVKGDFQNDGTFSPLLEVIDYVCQETSYITTDEDYAVFSYDEEGMLQE